MNGRLIALAGTHYRLLISTSSLLLPFRRLAERGNHKINGTKESEGKSHSFLFISSEGHIFAQSEEDTN